MEIPEFCTRATRRVTRKKKTELETDPDFDPKEKRARGRKSSGILVEPQWDPSEQVDSESSEVDEDKEENAGTMEVLKPWEARRRIIRRKRDWEEEPKPGLILVDRPKYAVDDWREKAEAAKKKREETRRKEGKKEVEFDYSVLEPIANEVDPYLQFLEGKQLTPQTFNLEGIPKWVMGEGKGQAQGPPKFELGSVWDYELLPCPSGGSQEEFEASLPWNRDVTEPDFQPEILGMVAGFTVGRKLDLKAVAEGSRNVEYNPDRFAPLIMRIREPKCTALIFSTGRILLTGVKSWEECRIAARKFARILQKMGMNVKVLGLSVKNISAHGHFGFRVRLNHLALNKLYGNLSYEPELFPGLIIPLEYPRMKVIVFSSGTVLMTGAKSEKDLEDAFKAVYPLVKMYAP